MATSAAMQSEQTLFARKATGLVRGWAVRDGFIYAFFSINLVTLGLFIFSYAPFIPDGSLLWAVVLSGVYLVFQAITYASLIAAMPRAGGDYVWISRILGGGVGFVLAVCGWWFILWHWVPIYANILNVEVFVPLFGILGWDGAVSFFSEPRGLFWASVVVAGLASVLIAVGMRTYARIQKICFYGAITGLAVMLLILLLSSKSDFISAYNTEARDLFGGGTYQALLQAGTTKAQYDPSSLGGLALGGTFLLIPFIVFFNLWSNWGATLYGEVRGSSDFRKNVYAMGGALLATTCLAIVCFLLFSKTFGWDFYNAANNAYWAGGDGAPPFWPYPGLMAAFLVHNPVLQFLLVGVLSLWFFGWVGTVFLSSTRVVFAAAFDRALPEAAAKVSRGGVPYAALALMLVPSIPISYMYAFNEKFNSWTLAATFVIAITFLGSAIAAAVLPWRKPDIYNASPIAKYRIGGVPLITAAACAFILILAFCIYKWFQADVYGINQSSSLIYMAALYVIALALYVIGRAVRKRQGIDLGMVNREIPAE
jgi:basic amino acid/polyamine antiporter, APA family